MRTFAVSTLREPPFPAGRHDGTEQVARDSVNWAREHDLIPSGRRLDRLRRADAAGLAGRAGPDAPLDRLRLLADLITWLFVMDDACDEDGLGATPTRLNPTVCGLLDVLDRHGAPGPPPPGAAELGVALDDLCRRVRARGRPATLLRFVAEMREYLLALLWEAGNREHRRVPPPDEYAQMRRHTGGVRPCLTLTDLALGVPPSADWRAAPDWVVLDLLATDLVCWCNDVVSYGKEQHVAPDPHNLVTVLAAGDGDGEAAALRAAAGRFNRGLDAFVRVERVLRADPAPGVDRALAVRCNWVRATYDWSLAVARYA
ncbi:Terpene synthase family, metal binding domain [Micromonospora nigra]|uniref:Terpene synthase n=1 Tax=Micromonospora nigra TaxID=145857 RepID=A0A1C6RFS7_9ACTN|nr:terpene synthase family protein [Micromonospora nigra]SCL15931.1 Terpene synthase family, metal binding domain [Micromonospora nigra]